MCRLTDEDRFTTGTMRRFRRADNRGIIPVGFSFDSDKYGPITRKGPGEWYYMTTGSDGGGKFGKLTRKQVLEVVPLPVLSDLTTWGDDS